MVMKAAFKIFLIPVVSIAVFLLPAWIALGLVVLQIILCFVLHFTLRQQLYDLRAILYYAGLLIFAKLAGAVFARDFSAEYFAAFIPTVFMLVKLLCVMQTASIVLRTTTSLEIREGFEKIELGVRRAFHLKEKAPVAQVLALFICFIPQVSKNWEQTKRAWFARGGKKSLRMLLVLLPVLFSIGFKQAYNSARAVSARQL